MCALRAPDQGRVIRLGVLQEGKIVLERRLDPGETLTVGAGPRATVRCTGASLPRRHALIEAHRGRYRLRVPRGLQGKLSSGGQVLSLDQLRQRPPSGRGRWDFELDDTARGSIRVGDLTLLFQLVQAPPIALGQLEKLDFRPSLISDDDPVFMGFLGLFTVVAASFVAYTSTIATPELVGTMEDVRRFASVVIPAPALADPDPVVPDAMVDDGLTREVAADTPEPDPEPTQAVAKNDRVPERPLTAEEAAYQEAQRKEDLRAEVFANSRMLQLIGSRGLSTNGFLDPEGAFGESLSVDLSDSKLPDGSADLVVHWKQGGGSGTSREDVGIQLDRLEGGRAGVTGGAEVGPTAVIRPDPHQPPPDSPEATRVNARIKRYYPDIKTCYERRLKENPTLQGRIEIQWLVDGGSAQEIYVVDNTTRDQELEDCIVHRMGFWQFDADIQEFSLSYPFVLAPG